MSSFTFHCSNMKIEQTLSKSQCRKWTLEKKFCCCPCQVSNTWPSNHESSTLPTKLSWPLATIKRRNAHFKPNFHSKGIVGDWPGMQWLNGPVESYDVITTFRQLFQGKVNILAKHNLKHRNSFFLCKGETSWGPPPPFCRVGLGGGSGDLAVL